MIRLLTGDVRDMLATLPANSVHCVITSPPYYGLRDYGVAGQLGFEATPEAYLATMVQVFREVRRVLRDDGTCWVNVGDSYAGNTETNGRSHNQNAGAIGNRANAGERKQGVRGGAKPKDLLMMPARLALALQADGWWLRSDIIWAKPNPMPESVTDRPTNAHEHIFLLTKRSRYFYDNEGVREPLQDSSLERGYSPAYLDAAHTTAKMGAADAADVRANGHFRAKPYVPAGRNLRNVWNVATFAYPSAHFATFPPELAERCIRAGTSERGCCVRCGKPWVRVTETERVKHTHTPGQNGRQSVPGSETSERSCFRTGLVPVTTTTGWSPGCTCNAEVAPCIVLDPFSGAGTALLVADRLGRDAVGIDLSHAYVSMARDRLTQDCPLFADISDAPVASEDAYDRDMRDLFAEAAE